MEKNLPLHGLWQMVRAEYIGEAAHELVTRNTTLELTPDSYTVRFDGEVADRGTVEQNAGAGTNVLLLRGSAGPNAGRTIPCIYQHVGDRLRVCYGLDGTAPAEFSTASGQQRYLATYRRKPK